MPALGFLSPLIPHTDGRWPVVRRGLYIGIVLAAILLLLWSGGFLTQLRLNLSDIYFAPLPATDHIVIVTIDDSSLAKYGRTPVEWPRTLLAELIDVLAREQARVIALDILLAEPTEADADLVAALRQSRTNAARTRVVMPVAGINQGETDVPDSASQAIRYTTVLRPLTAFTDVIDYTGFVNIFLDADGSLRRHISLVETANNQEFSFALATYLAYLRIPASAAAQVIRSEDSTLYVTEERPIPVDANGMWFINYFDTPTTAGRVGFPSFSFEAVLNGQFPPHTFQDKIVLVGVMRSTGATDLYRIPAASGNTRMNGIEIHANAIETLIQNVPLHEQRPQSQAIMIVVLSLVSSAAYSQLRWHWRFVAAGVFAALWILWSFFVFDTYLEIWNLFHALLAILLPVFVLLILDVVSETRRRQASEYLLQSAVAMSQGRLQVDHVLPRIAADAQELLQANQGTIWLWDDHQQQKRIVYNWPLNSPGAESLFEKTMEAASSQRTFTISESQVGIPIIWQGQVLAIITGQRSSNLPISPKTRQRVDSWIQQLAPSLENIFLFKRVTLQNMQLETLFANSPAAILVLDDTCALKRSNFAADKLLIFACTSYLGKPLVALLEAAKIASKTLRTITENLQRQEAFRIQMKHHDKTMIWDAVPLQHTGEWVVIISDVSALAELSDLKTRMLRMASHDLKNPLGALMGYGEMILQGATQDNPDMVVKFVKAMMKSANNMLTIITDILQLEHFRSGLLEKHPVDLGELVSTALKNHSFDIERQKLTLHCKITENLPIISGSSVQLTQAVSNLIGNAVKYTPAGGEITVRLWHSGSMVHFEVEDNGYGISKEDQKKLFQEFYRARIKSDQEIPGTGLGLSLVKAVIEAHGGSVWVQSKEGVGSTFFVELPCGEAATGKSDS